MATILQTQTGSSNATNTVTATWASNTTAGSLIVVVVNTTTTSTSSVTDSQGNTYTKIDEQTRSNSMSLWYAYNITGGTTPTITATVANVANNGIIVQEYSGTTTTDPLDKHVATSGTSASADSGATAATTQANELVVGWGGVISQAITVGSGFSHLTTKSWNNGIAMIEDKEITSTGAQNATFTMSADGWVCGVATFKEQTDLSVTKSDSVTLTESLTVYIALVDFTMPGNFMKRGVKIWP